MADLTEDQFAILHHAVTLARNESIYRLDGLRSRLEQQGYEPADIDVAINFWADYEGHKASRSKHPRAA
jgi:hypothetical protein